MIAETTVDNHKAIALELANRGIQFEADGDHHAARAAWRAALDYVEQDVPGGNIILWIRGGFGDALLQCGKYPGAADMAVTTVALYRNTIPSPNFAAR